MYYISIEVFFALGVSKNTIADGCKRYRQNRSVSWANKKDPNDKRKVLIDIDSIPEPTRKKYNIPTGREYYEKQVEDEWNATQEEIRKEKELRADAEKSALHNAYKNDYMRFVAIYKERYSYKITTDDSEAIVSAREHAFWLKMLEVTGTEFKTYDGGCKRGYKLYMELKSELTFSTYFTSENYFRALLTKLRKTALRGCISDVVAHNQKKPKAVKKTNDFHKGMAMAFLSHANKYSYRIVADLINYHCQEEKQPEITESWIKTVMASDNHFRTLVMASRNGDKYTKDNLLAHAVRKNTPFPANIWMLDGSPLQFYCWNESKTKVVRLNLFVIIDVCSRKIVGFDVSYHEDRFNIMNALKMAVMEQGHLPAEIVSDNFSASKSEEIKALVEQMAKIGTVWRHAKVGNPQDKSYVERFFGSFQSTEQTLYDDYIGEGIMSKRDNRRTAEQLLSNSKKSGFLTFNQMRDRVITMIVTYNQREKPNRKAPKWVYNALPKPNAKELDSVRTALLFWKRTKATVRKSMIKIVVDKVEHYYEVQNHKMSTELQGKQVFVRYDETDLERIMLFDLATETAICECKKSIKIATGHADRTDEDLENMYKVTAKQKSKKQYLETEKNKIIQSAINLTNKESIDLIHPRSLAKNKLTELDDLEQQERLRSMLKITNEDEEKPQNEPLETIHKAGIETDYINVIEQKKPQKGFNKPTLAGVDK